jgi:hypothetical protein
MMSKFSETSTTVTENLESTGIVLKKIMNINNLFWLKKKKHIY